jgi:hypothetical protein
MRRRNKKSGNTKVHLQNATRASVAREMAKPRMARSARIAELNLDTTLMDENGNLKKRTRVDVTVANSSKTQP